MKILWKVENTGYGWCLHLRKDEGKALTDGRLPYSILNMLSMLLFSLSLGFLSGTVSKNEDTLNGINHVVSLTLCFLGGIFVPQEFFGEGVLRVAKFFPTY